MLQIFEEDILGIDFITPLKYGPTCCRYYLFVVLYLSGAVKHKSRFGSDV